MEIIALGILTLIASIVGTITGFGTSTIMVPILAFFLPLPITLLFVGIIHWCGDVWKLILFGHSIKWRLIFLFGVPAILASYFGASLVLDIPETILLRILGGILLIYSVVSLFARLSFKNGEHPGTAMIGGATSGFIIGIVGIGGEIRAAFLSAFNLPKEVYLATIGAIAFVTDITRIGAYLYNGVRLSDFLLFSLIFMIPISFIGAKIAQKIVHKISEEYFRKTVLIVLLIISLKLILAP